MDKQVVVPRPGGATLEGRRRGFSRSAVICSLILGLSLILGQLESTWAQPHQNGLRDTINTPVPSPTAGPSSTPTQPVVAPVQRVLLRNGGEYSGTADTWIDAYTPRVPKPVTGGLRIKGGDIQAALIRHDLVGELPPNANVIEAELVFYVDIPAYTQARPLDVAAYRVLRHWPESQASWDYADAGTETLWSSPGCDGADNDRAGIPDDTITFDHRAVYRGFFVTESVRYWLQHPDENHGLLIKGISASSGTFSLGSSENSILEQRPVLRIDYTVGSTTPTPTPTVTTTGDLTATPTPTATRSTTPDAAVASMVGRQDTYIDEWNPDAVNGTLAYMYISSNGVQKALVDFDVSLISPGTQVISATLVMTTGVSGPVWPVDVAVYRLRKCWDEGSATWGQAMTDQNWSAPGASSDSADYAAGALDSANVASTDRAYSWDVTAAVQDWIGGLEDNCGFLLVGEPSTHAQWNFYSSEYPPGGGPQLLVTYMVEIPTPTATATPTLTPTPEGEHLTVSVYEDANRNGARDPGDRGISGVSVQLLDDASKQVLAQKTTIADGTCVFEGLVGGWYRVIEINPWGYMSSTADEIRVPVITGENSVSFGDYRGGAVALPIISK